MTDEQPTEHVGPRTAWVDFAVAVLILALGALVLYDSVRLGAKWGSDGPQPGYFPFYIGLLIVICSGVIIVQSLLALHKDRRIFVSAPQLRQVMVILIPSALYVLGIQLIGIYVSSAVYIGLFMKVMGRYGWLRSVLVSCGVSLTAFALFELWFKIPLPKGPLEALIGY
jgi:putative tricarboxylic transport membrane protein